MRVSAGANLGREADGSRNQRLFHDCGEALKWLTRVEIGRDRLDDLPQTF